MNKKTLFSRKQKPYVEGYVPEEEYVEKLGDAAKQINGMIQIIETTQTQIVELCRLLHDWEDCSEHCPYRNVRVLLRIPNQAVVYGLVNKQRLGEGGQDAIGTAIWNVNQDREKES